MIPEKSLERWEAFWKLESNLSNKQLARQSPLPSLLPWVVWPLRSLVWSSSHLSLLPPQC